MNDEFTTTFDYFHMIIFIQFSFILGSTPTHCFVHVYRVFCAVVVGLVLLLLGFCDIVLDLR